MLLFIGKPADRFIIVTALIANNSRRIWTAREEGKKKKKIEGTGPKSKCVYISTNAVFATPKDDGDTRYFYGLSAYGVRNATLGRLTHMA